MKQTQKSHSVTIPAKIIPYPTAREIFIAHILADYFQKNVRFVPKTSCKTADFLIDGRYWELKSPVGSGKRTMQHVLQNAALQAENVIIDLGLSKMNYTRARSRIAYESKYIPRIKRLLIINKNNKVFALK